MIALETAFVLSTHSSDVNETVRPYKRVFVLNFKWIMEILGPLLESSCVEAKSKSQVLGVFELWPYFENYYWVVLYIF